jgi:TRAP-type mannitol/chloroaromatic compound transport system permease large subunit
MPFNAAFALLNWYPLLTLPLFIYMGYMFSESGIASDLYRMFHVWMGTIPGGLAIGTMGLMVAVSAMNGLSVAGMAIGASLAMPEMLKRKYDKVMVTGVIQAGSSLGIMVPPAWCWCLYGMIARQPVGQLWLAGVFPGLLLAGLFIAYIYIRCRLQPHLGPTLSRKNWKTLPGGKNQTAAGRHRSPGHHLFHDRSFLLGITSLVQCSAAGATATTIAALAKGRLNWQGDGRNPEEHPERLLHVHVGHPGGPVLRRRVRRSGCRACHQSLFIERWGLSPMGVLVMMQLSYIFMGMFLDDTAMLIIVAPCMCPWSSTWASTPSGTGCSTPSPARSPT